MYSLINTNFIVPVIHSYTSYEDSIASLQHETILRSSIWTERIYMINMDEPDYIYTSDGTHIYLKNLTNGETKIIYTNKKITYLKHEYYVKFNDKNENNNISTNVDNLSSNNMSITINEKKNKNVKFITDDVMRIENDNHNTNTITNTECVIKENKDDNIKENEDDIKKNEDPNIKENEDDIKKEEIIKMIEEANDLYQKELLNIKRLELNLKTYDAKLKKLEKTKKDNIINEIIRTQSEYRTWKKIKYNLKNDTDESNILKPIEELNESNDVVPILFLSKYNYIDKIQSNPYIQKIFDEINHIDLNDLYANNELPNDDIVQFCNKYMKLSKELHYHFNDHEWNYLENEMNLNSTNKLGSNITTSTKI